MSNIKTSEQINEISEALARAQAKFSAAVKSSQNPAYRSKYADLSAVIEATIEHFNAEGIAVMQHPMLEYKGGEDTREAMITVTTRLQHKSGQYIESDLSIPAVQRERFDAQSCGSAITYACRYALQSIGVVPREDDDANSASGIGTREAAQAVAKKKISEAAAAGNKTAQQAEEKQQKETSTLLYCYPKEHNGHFAEWLNVRSFLGTHPDLEERLLLTFSMHKAKKTKEDTSKVPHEQMESLLAVLSGDLGLTVHELAGR